MITAVGLLWSWNQESYSLGKYCINTSAGGSFIANLQV